MQENARTYAKISVGTDNMSAPAGDWLQSAADRIGYNPNNDKKVLETVANTIPYVMVPFHLYAGWQSNWQRDFYGNNMAWWNWVLMGVGAGLPGSRYLPNRVETYIFTPLILDLGSNAVRPKPQCPQCPPTP